MLVAIVSIHTLLLLWLLQFLIAAIATWLAKRSSRRHMQRIADQAEQSQRLSRQIRAEEKRREAALAAAAVAEADRNARIAAGTY
jgi:hypothetical protein